MMTYPHPSNVRASPSVKGFVGRMGKFILVILLLGLLYPLSFFVIMDTSFPAFNEYGLKTYECHFRLAPSVKISRDLSIYGPKETWLNWVYYPMERWLKDRRGNA